MKESKNRLSSLGFTVVEDIFSEAEIDAIAGSIEKVDLDKPSFRKARNLFAIRQFFKEIPSIQSLVFNNKLCAVIKGILGDDFFVVKSIYFDKPDHSNWFVAFHQDLTISVDRKVEFEGYKFWTVKQDQFAVQPPIDILQNIFTIRIHLDDTDEDNGALRVIPGSQLRGIYRPETINWTLETETICNVKKGSIMIMRPLLLHASGRTVNKMRRRVIHVELCNLQLPAGMKWGEHIDIRC